jgi:hypothetical protein
VSEASTPARAARQETALITGLVAGALVVGAVLQIWIPPGPLTLVAAAGIASLVVLGLAFSLPGRLRATLSGFRFTSTLLIALALFAVIGTLVLQGKPAQLYLQRYGAVGRLILALRFDDIFHGLPYAGLVSLFGAAILASATLRWPISFKRAGFFVAHLGLLISGAGAAASSVLAVRGRIDLLAGGDVARSVVVTKGGISTGETRALGFDLKLDMFDLVNYDTEYRVGYYEKLAVKRGDQVLTDWRLKTSFDPDTSSHRLPGGDAFRLKGVYPDFVETPQVTPAAAGGAPALEATLAGETRWIMPGEGFATPDGLTAVVLAQGRPAAPTGVMTSFLVSAGERKVIIHTGDGEMTTPLVEGMSLGGGLVKLGRFVPSATRTLVYGTRSQQWRNPAAVLETTLGGRVQEQLVYANQPRGIFLQPDRTALVFEKRDKEVKAFRSHVTVTQGSQVEHAVISVNDPLDFAGWTLYQVNFNPEQPNYSGLEAVRDPGVRWVFFGFALICAGVAYMFYVEPKLRGGGIDRSGAPAEAPPLPAAQA